MKESNVSTKIQIAVSKLTNATLFRNNTGIGWVGSKKQAKNGNGIFIEDPRPLHAGLCNGSSDLIGWNTIEIKPEMVGEKIAVFTAVEIKSEKGVISKDQLNFLKRVKDSGGIAGVATSPDEAINLLNNNLLPLT